MKYTYEISFNGSDYVPLTPGQDVKMSGEWVTGTKIWRENISELKITKRQNSTIYDTLEIYFTDATKFATRIYVKILKNGAQDSLHWFGVKWGAIDKEKKTYTVQPLVYDLWAQSYEPVYDVKTGIVPSIDTYTWHNVTTNYPYMGHAEGANIFNYLKTASSGVFTMDDIKSSILNGDDDEDGTAVTTEYGLPIDYVTGEQSLLINAGMTMTIYKRPTFSEYFDFLKLFNIYPYFDINNHFRLEHLSYFIDKLTDNAVDFSAYINDTHNQWEYVTEQLPVADRIKMPDEDGQSEEDFITYDIIYSNVQNRPDVQKRELSTQYFSDLYELTGLISDKDLIFSCYGTNAYEFTNVDIVDFSTDKNYISMPQSLVSDYVYATSNDFSVTIGAYGVDVTVQTTTLAATMGLTIRKRSDGTALSNTIVVSSPGTTTGNFTISNSSEDAYLEVEIRSFGRFIGYIILTDELVKTAANVTGFLSGDVKTNGHFSVANIFNNYWKDNGLSRSATYNGDAVTFDNTEYNLRRKEVRMHYTGTINPLYGVNDGTRIAMIEKWERDLDTDFYTLYLIYQEDE